MTIYQQLRANHIPMQHDSCHLLALDCPETRDIIKLYHHHERVSLKPIKDKPTGCVELWYLIPYAYDPFWEGMMTPPMVGRTH